MLQAIVPYEAAAATAFAIFAITRWVKHRRAAAAESRRASELDEECERLAAAVTRLSGQVDIERGRADPRKRPAVKDPKTGRFVRAA